MIIVLLGLILLASLIFYVVNVGDQVNRRVAMQNAADAATISGASWMARSMNVIGMNNVAEMRMLALVPVLDSLPLATKMTAEEMTSWAACLTAQLQVGVPDTYLRDGLQALQTRFTNERNILTPMNDYLNNSGFDTASLTFWTIRGQGGMAPSGALWQAAQSCDNFGQATLASAGVLSQANAVRYGQETDYAETSFIVPVLPELPGKRTTYNDFSRVVRTGLIPDRLSPQRLGPCDRLFKWRDYRYQNLTEPDRWIPGQAGHGPIRGGNRSVGMGDKTTGASAVGQPTDADGHWAERVVGQILLGYRVYGPYEWMMRRISDYAGTNLQDTFFSSYERTIGNIKLGYMWGSQSIRQVHYPQWIIDYPTAKQTASDPAVRVYRTMYYVFETRSRYPQDSGSYHSAGSFKTNGPAPIATWYRGWQNPEKWNIKKIANWIWEDDWSYETTEDVDIGIVKQMEADGKTPVWQKVYMISQFVWGGIDVGGNVDVRNPADFTDRTDLPAPILMDTVTYGDYDMSQPNHDLGVRRDVFTYLGVAMEGNKPVVWPQRFGSGNPYPHVMGLAQAEIFNTTSWDLWTQDWKAKMVPLSQWDDWMDRLDKGVGQAGDTDGHVDGDVVREVQQYLKAFNADMAKQMMQH
jgi:hypothetical protein